MKLNAIQSLWNKDCHQDDTGNIFIAGKKPTAAENKAIDAEVLRLEAAQVATQYQRDRAVEYAKLNQDELRFDDMINGTTLWKDAILAIKAKYPKPKPKVKLV